MSENNYVTWDEFQRVLDYLQSGAGKIGAIEQRLTNIETDIGKIERVVTDGNGQPSLIYQVSSIRTDIMSIKEDVVATNMVDIGTRREVAELTIKVGNLAESAKRVAEYRRDRDKIRFQAWIAVMCSLIAATAAIVAAILKR